MQSNRKSLLATEWIFCDVFTITGYHFKVSEQVDPGSVLLPVPNDIVAFIGKPGRTGIKFLATVELV